MKKVAFALIGLLAVLVAAVLIGPSFIDWNGYKGRIVAAVQDTIGRAAAIDGDVSFTVLPAPALRVAGVRIANFDGARTKDMLQLKELRLRISVGALLEGRIAIEQLDLIEPVLALETGADGKASWNIEIATGAAENAGADSGGGAGGSIDISLAGVTIQNGSVRYSAAGAAAPVTVDRLNMAVSAPSLTGPFDITAEARFGDVPFSMALKTGAVKPGQPIGISLKLALIDAAASIAFTGRLTAPGPDALISGTVTLSGDSAAKLASLGTAAPLPAVLRQAITFEGTVMASGQAVSLNDTRFQLGDTAGNGAVSITLGDVIGADIAMSVNRLDLDALLAETGALAGKDPAAAPSAAASSAAAAPKPAFSLPANINASLDLAVEAIKYRGGVIRQAGLRGSLANGAVTLDRASALLPGGSDISLVGILQAVNGEPLFEGEIVAASDNLRGMLRWLGVDTQALPADRLGGFSFASKLTATPTAIQIPDINLRLDASTATGGLAVALRERPGFGLRLDIDRLNLDAYLPKPAKGKRAAPQSAGAGPAKQASPPARGALAFLDRFDANIDARVGRLTIAKAVARKVAFTGQIVGGVLSIKKFRVADVAGMRVSATGTVQGFATTPSFATNFDIAIGKPEQLFRLLDTPLPVPREKLGKPTVKGRVSGTASAIKLAADIAAAGGTFRFDGAVGLTGAAPSIDAAMTVNFPELADFIRLAAPEFNPAAAKLGAMKASFKIKGVPSNLRISALDMTAGPVAVKGEAAYRSDGPRPSITANLATSEVLLDLFQPAPKPTGAATARGRLRANGSAANGARSAGGRWSSEPIDMTALRGIDADVTLAMSGIVSGRIQLGKPELAAVLKAGRLEVKRFRAGLFGGTVSGTAILDAGRASPVLSAKVSVRNIDMVTVAKTFGGDARVAGPLSVDATLNSAGTSEAALIAALGGQGTIGGKARILATKQEKRALDTLGIAAALFGSKVKELGRVGGLSSVLLKAFGNAPADLSGNFTIQRGIVRTSNATLSGAGARAVSAGAVDLPRWLIDMTTSVFRSGDAGQTPYVSLRLNGAVDAPNVKASGAFLSGGTGTAAPASNPLQQLLPGLLGTKKDAPREKTKPADLLRGLLKGLGR